MSLLDGPNEGNWSVFAEKVVSERDALQEQLAETQKKLDAALETAQRFRVAIERLMREMDKPGGLMAGVYSVACDAVDLLEAEVPAPTSPAPRTVIRITCPSCGTSGWHRVDPHDGRLARCSKCSEAIFL